MAYDDRDYFQSKPKFEFASGLPNGTKGLMIAVIAAYVASIVISNHLGFVGEDFWGNLANGNKQARNAYLAFVLVPQNIIPVRGAFDPGHWKLLTHWVFPPTIITAVLDVFMIYFAGRLVEPLFGTRRYLIFFVTTAVVAGLLASVVDPWIVGSGKTSVIMGPVAAIFAVFVTFIWIAPEQKWFLGWKLKNVTIGAVVIFGGISLLIAVFSDAPAVTSPTQLIWGAAAGSAYMMWLKKQGRVPSFAGGFKGQDENLEAWQKPGYMHDYKDDAASEAKFNKTAGKQRKEEEKATKQRAADQEKLDAILEKISTGGMTTLSKSEKKFLDSQSKKRRD